MSEKKPKLRFHLGDEPAPEPVIDVRLRWELLDGNVRVWASSPDTDKIVAVFRSDGTLFRPCSAHRVGFQTDVQGRIIDATENAELVRLREFEELWDWVKRHAGQWFDSTTKLIMGFRQNGPGDFEDAVRDAVRAEKQVREVEKGPTDAEL